jgi:hypothetical protein
MTRNPHIHLREIVARMPAPDVVVERYSERVELDPAPQELGVRRAVRIRQPVDLDRLQLGREPIPAIGKP